MRCGTPRTSGHVTAKSHIHGLGVLYKSGVYALKAVRLTPGGLFCATGTRVRVKMAERREIGADRGREVSRGHSTRNKRRRPELHSG